MANQANQGELRVWLPVRVLDALDQVGRELGQTRPATVEQLLESGLRHYEAAARPALEEAPQELGQAPAGRWE